MIISCAVCGDVFTGVNPDETVYATTCGHLFHYNCLIEWLERSKTCPQCRQKTTEKSIIRLFLNNANLTGPDADPALLKHRLDSLEFQLKLNEKEINVLKEEKKKVNNQNRGLRKEMKEFMKKNIYNEQQLLAVTDELKSVKSYCKNLSEIKLENEELKKELVACKSVNMIINGTADEAKCVVDNSNLDAEHLQMCVKYFKEKIKKLESEYKDTEKEILFYKKKVACQKKEINEFKRNNSSMLGRRTRDDSIIQISSDDGGDIMGSFGNEIGHQKENVYEAIMLSSSERAESLSSSLVENSSFKKMRVSKPDASYKSKTTSLLGLTQPKSCFQITKSMSPLTAYGDDKYCPSKYDTAGKVTKKSKKHLSSSAVPTLKKNNIVTNQKISKHFQIL